MKRLPSFNEPKALMLLGAGLWLLAWGPIARSEIISCGPTPNHFEYDVKGAEMDVTVFHPFHVFRGVSHTITGTMQVNPENLREGLLIKLAAPLKAIEMPDIPARRVLALILASEENAQFQFLSQVVDLPPTTKAVPQHFRMRTLGELDFRGVSLPAVIPADCSVESEFWRCQFRFTIRLSDFGLPSPELLMVPAHDNVEINGEVTLGPKRES